MTDVYDRAQELEATLRADALAHHARRIERQGKPAVSLLECEDCGDPIPQPRRLAVTGCTTCIECQTARERPRV